jgi:peptidoglycan hydrolase-like protein with peptidoglycan-binding domain
MPPTPSATAPAPAQARMLTVASPLLSGPDVTRLQRRLAALRYEPGAADGFYGDATAAAVRAFQADHGLEVDGVVGAQTRRALKTASPRARGHAASAGAGAGGAGAKALAEALRHLGTTESPSGSNRTAFGRWFGMDGVPWCNIFVSYCFSTGAGYTICSGFRGAGVTAKGCAYVPSTEAWLRGAGYWVGRTAPRPGDIAIYNWDGGVPDHIGIVEADLGGGRFRAIEGNTAVGNDSNGGQVMRRDRTLAQVDGFGRIRG